MTELRAALAIQPTRDTAWEPIEPLDPDDLDIDSWMIEDFRDELTGIIA